MAHRTFEVSYLRKSRISENPLKSDFHSCLTQELPSGVVVVVVAVEEEEEEEEKEEEGEEKDGEEEKEEEEEEEEMDLIQ